MQKSGGVCKYGEQKAVYMQIFGTKFQKYFSAKNELALFVRYCYYCVFLSVLIFTVQNAIKSIQKFCRKTFAPGLKCMFCVFYACIYLFMVYNIFAISGAVAERAGCPALSFVKGGFDFG